MQLSTAIALRVAATAVPIASLIGCGSGWPQLAPASAFAKAVAPDCCVRANTMFVTEFDGVQLYTYPQSRYIKQLTPPPEGFSGQSGECVDGGGNVYIANMDKSTIDEYSHDGAFVQALNDPGQYPVACSYSVGANTLAVSNILSKSGGQGSISLYHGGVLQNTYYPANIYRVYFLGFQNAGTLWLDGISPSGTFQYDKFFEGTFTPVPISGGTIGFPGEVQWSDKTDSMNVGDQSATVVYQVSRTGAITGSTKLTCINSSRCDYVGTFIKHSNIVVATGNDILLYQYPAGGSPTKVFRPKQLSGASDVVISPDVAPTP